MGLLQQRQWINPLQIFHLLRGVNPDSHSEQNFPELSGFAKWVAEGRAGEMEYLKRRDTADQFLRSSVQIPFPWVRSVIVCAVNYNSDQPYSIDFDGANATEPKGWITRPRRAAQQTPTSKEVGGKSRSRLHPSIRLRTLCTKLNKSSRKRLVVSLIKKNSSSVSMPGMPGLVKTPA